MRFIPTFCLQEGMLLSQSLYNGSGNLLLKEGTYIKKQYIDKIMELGFQGVYIEDDISKNIEIKSVISDELRWKAVQRIKNMFIDIQNETMNVNESIEDVNMIVENIIDELLDNRNLMVNMMDIKLFDDYTFFHCVNVTVLSIIMGISLNLNRKELYELGMGALLHDIGKVFVHQDLLNKNGKLTNEEFNIIKEHPLEGYRYIKTKFDIPVKSYIAILQHHEKYDGTGYPNNRAGDDICLFGRIIAIADVYDALTSDRPYRKGLLPSDAIEYIMGGAGTHFDFELVSLFVRKVAAYPIGTCVKLSDGRIGIVVENFPDACTRPKVKLVSEDNEEDIYIDLKDDFSNKNLTVTDIVNM